MRINSRSKLFHLDYLLSGIYIAFKYRKDIRYTRDINKLQLSPFSFPLSLSLSLSLLDYWFPLFFVRSFHRFTMGRICEYTSLSRGTCITKGEMQLNCLSDRNEAVNVTLKYIVMGFRRRSRKSLTITFAVWQTLVSRGFVMSLHPDPLPKMHVNVLIA